MEILLTGTSRVGKTSIKNVVFDDTSPHATVFLESNTEVDIKDSSILTSKIKVYDVPQSADHAKVISELSKSSIKVLVFVIDLHEQTDQTYDHFKKVLQAIEPVKENIQLEVFLHKSEGHLHSQPNSNNLRNTITKALKDILNANYMNFQLPITATSIFDHSIFEAFSNIYQKNLTKNTFLSNLLDSLIDASKLEKTFLFDVRNKVYLATDSNIFDMKMFEICSDMIDVIKDTEGIYGSGSTDMDDNRYSVIKINKISGEESPCYVLYLRQLSSELAFIAIIDEKNYDRQHLLDYNIEVMTKAINEIIEL